MGGTIDASSIEEERRILNNEIEEEEKEKESTKGKEEHVPIVSADCADTEGLIVVADSGDKLNCRQIRKSKLCDRERNGEPSYESCPKSCELCVEPIPTTDAPTADLIELVVSSTIDPTRYESVAPSYQPTIKLTDDPTESPSHYPTDMPTENAVADIMQ